MITIRRSGERGSTRLGWLDSRHTFSFGEHHDPRWAGFHDLLVTYAGNSRLAEIYRRITRELHLFRLQGLYAGGAVPSNVEHWNILKAIQSGSAERAAAAMRIHIEAARARMLKAVKRR